MGVARVRRRRFEDGREGEMEWVCNLPIVSDPLIQIDTKGVISTKGRRRVLRILSKRVLSLACSRMDRIYAACLLVVCILGPIFVVELRWSLSELVEFVGEPLWAFEAFVRGGKL